MSKQLAESSQASDTPRFVLVDSYRFICAAWVMWIHLPQSTVMIATTNVARFRLAFFVLVAVFFQLYQLARRPAWEFTSYSYGRVRRLYLPFLAWGLLYYFAGGIHRMITERPWPSLTPEFFLYGSSIHLWFIPYILAVGLVTYPLSRFVLRQRHRAAVVMGVSAFAGLAGCVAAPIIIAHALPTTPWTDPIYREVELLPCIPLGIACYFLFAQLRSITEKKKQLLYRIAAMAVAIGFVVDAWFYHGAPVQNPVALCMVILTLQPAKWRIWSTLGRWGKYSFGMYAVHLFFVGGMHILREMVFHFSPVWWYDLLSFAVCVPASLLATIALSRFSATRWMVPTGEKRQSKPPQPIAAPVAQLQEA
ncbi:MAG TPA: acyltransferase [Phycisphaerae bacterium]|nr:acyltransferase [Phycisphaerae bacterium]